jgi:hypothetical protein
LTVSRGPGWYTSVSESDEKNGVTSSTCAAWPFSVTIQRAPASAAALPAGAVPGVRLNAVVPSGCGTLPPWLPASKQLQTAPVA